VAATLAFLLHAPLRAPLPAASLAFFHHLAPTRPGRPRPSRSSTAPLSTRSVWPRSSRSSPTSLSRAPCGRVPRVLPPPRAPRPGRPLPARPSTAPLSAPRSAATTALLLRAPLRAPVGRVPCALPPRRSLRASRPLPTRSSTAPPSARCGRRRCAASPQRGIAACDGAARGRCKRPHVS
jgi:hypothetical protein